MSKADRPVQSAQDPSAGFFFQSAFGLSYEDRQRGLLKALTEGYRHHYASCESYARYCALQGFGPNSSFESIEDFPYLPAQAFKRYANRLVSVGGGAIRTSLSSSATSGIPSTVFIDALTSRRQIQCLANVLSSSIGGTRRPFLVCDVDPATAPVAVVGARGAAVRGFLNLARESYYALRIAEDGRLQVDMEAVLAFRKRVISAGLPFVVFGFTYVLYNDVLKPLLELAPQPKACLGFVCHIGGWKKLEDESVDRATFAAAAAHVFGVSPESVIDFYGFTEQMGVVYPTVDLHGLRIAPSFADVVVRDIDTLKPRSAGEPGLLEFVTPLPFSYPGIAVLTDDYGVIVDRHGTLEDGRRGTLFKVLGRAKNVEVRGCGDVMATKVVRRVAFADHERSAKFSNRVLFHGDIKIQPSKALQDIAIDSLPDTGISELVDSVIAARERLLSYSAEERIQIIAAAAAAWGDPQGPLAPLRTQGLSFLQRWCEAPRLRRLMDEGLRGRRGGLDGMVATSTPGRFVKAVPRGLCAHWLSGNVPVLGMLALVQCIITGNANILKAASSFSGVLPAILDALSRVETKSFTGRLLKGEDITSSIAVVYFDRGDVRSAEALSRAADIRVAWGGREAVESIVNLPKKYDCEDVVFGPKLSFAVVGKEHLTAEAALKRVARRVATDCSVFDQHGCANPHTIFVESDDAASVESFCGRLADEMRHALFRIPKAPIDGGAASQITAARLEYELGGRGRIWRSPGTEWTVLFDPSAELLSAPTYSRVVHVRRVSDALQVADLVTPDIQSVGLALDPVRRHAFASIASRLGAVRFPELGRMTEFDVAWDGLYLADRSVRWVTVGGPFS
jgi:hypothetical protein